MTNTAAAGSFRRPRHLLRLGGSRRRRPGDGRNAARANAGSRPDHRAAARRSWREPRAVRADQLRRHVDRLPLRGYRRAGRSARQPDGAHGAGDSAGRRRRGHEPGARCRHAAGADHADAWPRPERPVGGQPGDARQVVPPPPDLGDGRVCGRDEPRLHDGLSDRGVAGSHLGMASDMGGDWCGADPRIGACRVGAGSAGAGDEPGARGRRRRPIRRAHRRLDTRRDACDRRPSGCSAWRARCMASSRRGSACSTSRSWPRAALRPASITRRWRSPPSPGSPATSPPARGPIAVRCAGCSSPPSCC